MPLAFPQPLFFPALVPIDKTNNNKNLLKNVYLLKRKKKRKRSSPNKGKNLIIILRNKLIKKHISHLEFVLDLSHIQAQEYYFNSKRN